DSLCYNAGKVSPSWRQHQLAEEYDKPTGQQSNKQQGGPIEERQCSGSAIARVHLWCLSSRLAGSPALDRRPVEEPYFSPYALETVAVRSRTTGFQEPTRG